MTSNHYYCVVWSPSDIEEVHFLSKSSDYKDKNQVDSKDTLTLLEFAFNYHFILRPVVLIRSSDLYHGVQSSLQQLHALKSDVAIALTTMNRTISFKEYDSHYFKTLYGWAKSHLPNFTIHRM